MEIYRGELSDVTRYLANHEGEELAEREPEFRRIFGYVGRFKAVQPGMKLLEIGTGTGSIPILCRMNGLDCKGLEISQQLVDHGRAWGKSLGVEPDIELGNIETSDIGTEAYDVIIASSVFEHIEYWRPALAKVFRALKPGGALFFESTNKFSLVSGEYHFPLYGWLPNSWRYRMRIAAQGPEIMKLGIDFNQFTYSGLRRAFRSVGFAEIHDVVELLDDSRPRNALKRAVIGLSRSVRPFREIVLVFHPATTFVCLKAPSAAGRH